MVLKNLHLLNYRNHSNPFYEFDDNLNIIFGPNGAGKTNILEAIHLLSIKKGFRALYERELIKHDQNLAFIKAKFQSAKDTSDSLIEIKITKEGKKLKKEINEQESLNSIIFIPEHLNLVSGTPSNRRSFIDTAVLQTHNGYNEYSNKYKKSLAQRNSLLKQSKGYLGKSQRSQLDFWDKTLIDLGTKIQFARTEFFKYLNYAILENANAISPENKFEVSYVKSVINEQTLNDALNTDLRYGFTSIGPHRDDFTFYLDSKNMNTFSSRGQQRTAALILKLSEKDYIDFKNNTNSILLLDDVFSELDAMHRDKILNIISKQQTFITFAIKPEIALPRHKMIQL